MLQWTLFNCECVINILCIKMTASAVVALHVDIKCELAVFTTSYKNLRNEQPANVNLYWWFFAQFMFMIKVKHSATMQAEIWEKNFLDHPNVQKLVCTLQEFGNPFKDKNDLIDIHSLNFWSSLKFLCTFYASFKAPWRWKDLHLHGMPETLLHTIWIDGTYIHPLGLQAL